MIPYPARITWIAVLLAGCARVTVTQGPALTAEPSTATVAAATEAPSTATPDGTATPTLAVPPQLQFIAYVFDGQLLVTDITRHAIDGTTQYTVQGESDQVSDLVWSPSGEFIAFVAAPKGIQHVFFIYAEGASTPTDLGAGSSPAWSPDSRTVAYVGGTYPDENIYITSIDNPVPRQMTFEKNHAWGRPAFTPDGMALIVSTADRNFMGAQGNTSFTLQRLALDGSGTRTSLPGATELEGVRLPYDLRVSPDGTRLAFSSSGTCTLPGAYYVSDFSGTRQELVSPTLWAASDPINKRYYESLGYAWMPSSDALMASSSVIDCDMKSPTMGQAVAGPQMSILGLDGTEGMSIPGLFYSLSVDRTGTLIAASVIRDAESGTQLVEVFSAQTGQLMMSLGPGKLPELQP